MAAGVAAHIVHVLNCFVLLSMEPWAATKNLVPSVAVPPAPVRVPSKRLLAPNVTPVTSVANGKGDNEMIPVDVHRSPGIYLMTEENTGKLQLGDRLMKGLCDHSSPQMGPLSSK